jgi:hypothetical protein
MIKGKLLVAEQWFLRNKKAEQCPQDVASLEVALDCLSFYFDEAVKIVCWDIAESLSLLVHKINCVRKDFPRDD